MFVVGSWNLVVVVLQLMSMPFLFLLLFRSVVVVVSRLLCVVFVVDLLLVVAAVDVGCFVVVVVVVVCLFMLLWLVDGMCCFAAASAAGPVVIIVAGCPRRQHCRLFVFVTVSFRNLSGSISDRQRRWRRRRAPVFSRARPHEHPRGLAAASYVEGHVPRVRKDEGWPLRAFAAHSGQTRRLTPGAGCCREANAQQLHGLDRYIRAY